MMKSSFLEPRYRSETMHPLMETIPHNHIECGDKRGRLFVTRTEAGWLFHCHNCAGGPDGLTGFMRIEVDKSPTATVKRYEDSLKKAPHTKLSTATYRGLPHDYTSKLPDRAKLWLDKYGLTEEELDMYGVGYSAQYDRIVFPIYDPDSVALYRDVVGWQGRCVRGDNVRPKYITYKPTTAHLIFNSNVTHCEPIPEEEADDLLVIVEDIVSAIKVGRQAQAIACLGSYIGNKLTLMVMNRRRVYIWLDEDKHKESQGFSHRLRGLGVNAVTLCTNYDPKEIRDTEIEMMLV